MGHKHASLAQSGSRAADFRKSCLRDVKSNVSNMKTCSICKQVKDLSEFNKHAKRPDGLQNVCRTCNRERSRAYYKRNPTLHRENVRRRNKQITQAHREYVAALKSNPCVDCGQSFIPFAMDFDHVRGEKVSNISALGRFASRQKLDEEIAKCELVCAVCHRIRTWSRMSEEAKAKAILE